MVDPQSSRMIILNAAAELMVENEHAGARAALSLGAVAKRAGVSRTTIYRNFDDRDGLMAALEESHGLAVGASTTRERILDAFGRVLPERSLKTITVEGVAEEAGVSAVTVYRQFDDRVGLVQTYFIERGPRHDAAELLVGTDADPVETLVVFVTRLVAFMKAHRALVLEMLSPDAETQELLSAMKRGDKRTHLAVIGFMAGQIERGNIRAANPAEPAMALFSMVLGFAAILSFPERRPSMDAPADDDRAMAEKIVGFFWNGFGT